MFTLLAGYTKPLNRDDVTQEGFTNQELDSLVRLRRSYPYIEYFDRDEWPRIQFLRWLYQHGYFNQ